MKDINMILSIKISQEQNEDSKLTFTDEISTAIESCLKDNINEILENEKANKLSVSTIYRMIEESNQQHISSVILYRFIAASIKERRVLLKFVKLEELSDETFEDIFIKYNLKINQQLSEQQKEISKTYENNTLNEYIRNSKRIRYEEDSISFEIIEELLSKYGDLTKFEKSGIY